MSRSLFLRKWFKKRLPAAPARHWSSLPVVLVITASAVLAVLSVLIFLLLVVSQNQALYERYYGILFYTNLVAGGLLLLVIIWVVGRLGLRLRKRKFGARLMLNLAAAFALVGVLPGLVIYGVSYQFVARSIESWFDVRVEGALQAGLNLGVGTLDTLAQDLSNQTRAATNEWTELPGYGLGLERLRVQLNASDLQVWNTQGKLIASSGDTRFELLPQRPGAEVLQELNRRSAFTTIEGLDDAEADGRADTGRLHLWAKLKTGGYGLDEQRHILHVTQKLPTELMRNALQVQSAYREYKERSLARQGLRSMYIGTLTLSLILAVLAAVLLAVLTSSRLMRPLLLLSDGVAKVAAGDLQAQASRARLFGAGDELSDLTQSFAQMTVQLAAAQNRAQRSMVALEGARTYLQTILDNQTSGVLVLSQDGLLLSVNAGATRVLREPVAAYLGQPLAAVPHMAELAAKVHDLFAGLGDKQSHGGSLSDHWEQTFVLEPDGGSEGEDAKRVRTVLARGALLPATEQVPNPNNDEGGLGPDFSLAFSAHPGQRLLLVDDITAMVSAQRSQAWAEVARRLAHEIKNPLTPIQLSAERLQMKLTGKLEPADTALLDKSVATIVNQVGALKRLVDEFRDYARLPSAHLQTLDLNALLLEVAHLYAHSSVPVQLQLLENAPLILGDPQQLRQVIHNLVQNAQDAAQSRYEADLALRQSGADAPASSSLPILVPPLVQLITQMGSSGERLRLVVRDNGAGFPEHILRRAFEPYVTTKTKGTGLGLAVVKKIADEHGARIDISNIASSAAEAETDGLGASPDGKKAEKAAQSPALAEFAVGAQVTLSLPLAPLLARGGIIAG